MCSSMPKGLSIADSGEGWRIRFREGSEWRREVSYCPFCGTRLSRRNAFAGGAPRNARAVRCVDTGEVYESQSAAAIAHGVAQTTISACCRGKVERLKSGMRFEFA